MSMTRPLRRPDATTARTGEDSSVMEGAWKWVKIVARRVVNRRVGNNGGTGSRMRRCLESIMRCLEEELLEFCIPNSHSNDQLQQARIGQPKLFQ